MLMENLVYVEKSEKAYDNSISFSSEFQGIENKINTLEMDVDEIKTGIKENTNTIEEIKLHTNEKINELRQMNIEALNDMIQNHIKLEMIIIISTIINIILHIFL